MNDTSTCYKFHLAEFMADISTNDRWLGKNRAIWYDVVFHVPGCDNISQHFMFDLTNYSSQITKDFYCQAIKHLT